MANLADGSVHRSSARLRDLWADGHPAFGLWSVLPDPTVAELLAASRFDYVCIDLQHGIATTADLPALVRAMRAAGRAPVVRVSSNDPVSINRALDVGASAVVVPMVESADDARRAAVACRYPPAGTRSWGPMWGDLRRDGTATPAEQDADAICLVMVETKAGVDALDDIVAVPGIDGVYIGPNDLALSCGLGRDTYRDSPEVDALIHHVVAECKDAGLVTGLHCSDVEMAAHWAARDVRMLTVGQDTTLLATAVRAAWSALPVPGRGPAERRPA